MRTGQYQIVIGIAGATTLAAAALLVWLFLTEPVALASAISGEDLSELAGAVGQAILSGLRTLVYYL